MNNLLIVDDNQMMTNSLGEIFDTAGYEVHFAYDGVQGWELIQSHTPDIILADINMPGMDGFQFLQLIRDYETTATVPFIFLTGRSNREDWRKGMALGADDYITKPFRALEIIESVKTTLTKRQKIKETSDKTLTLLRKNITYALPHELRTPLQTIIGYSHIMKMDHQELSSDDILMMSTELAHAGQRLQHLIENALAYAQIEIIGSDQQQQQQLRNNVVTNTSELIRYKAGLVANKWRRSHDLKFDLDNSVLQISEENLSRIIEELVDNAFKFSEAGSPVTIQSMSDKNYHAIVIHDQGRGMSPQQLQQIGPYMQFDRIMYEQQGFGLGLTVAKRLVELHNGTIHIRSVPEDGTFITIKFRKSQS